MCKRMFLMASKLRLADDASTNLVYSDYITLCESLTNEIFKSEAGKFTIIDIEDIQEKQKYIDMIKNSFSQRVNELPITNTVEAKKNLYFILTSQVTDPDGYVNFHNLDVGAGKDVIWLDMYLSGEK